MVKRNYSKYTTEDFINLIEKQEKQIEKLKENEKVYEKHLDIREKKIKELEKEKEEWFGIESHSAAYANVKQFEAIQKRFEAYRDLYDNSQKSKEEMKEYFQKTIEDMKTKEKVHIHNERGAGRKALSEEIISVVKKLKNEHKEYSTRKISEELKKQGISISYTKVAEIIKA